MHDFAAKSPEMARELSNHRARMGPILNKLFSGECTPTSNRTAPHRTAPHG